MKKNLWLVPIEPIETRYTTHWYHYLPKQLEKSLQNYDVQVVEVPFPKAPNTPGAFLNFANTVDFKSRQMASIADLFSEGMVQQGDLFLITDYWNPSAHSIRYMSELLGIPVNIVGICHAGDWDPADILHQKFKDKTWSFFLERSLDKLYDVKIFATNFSKSLYEESFGASSKNVVTGFPMEYYDDFLPRYWEMDNPPEKENLIVYPHRKSPEKNLNLFLKLKEEMPEYEFVVAIDVCSNKDQYHDLLYRAKLCFSAALQETLGISMGIEALRCGSDVLVPDRLSYKEMGFANVSRFPGDMAATYDCENDPDVVEYLKREIDFKMGSYNLGLVRIQHDYNFENFFTGTRFYQTLDAL